MAFLLTNNVELKNLFYKFDFILLNLSDTIMQKMKENLAMPNLERCSRSVYMYVLDLCICTCYSMYTNVNLIAFKFTTKGNTLSLSPMSLPILTVS